MRAAPAHRKPRPRDSTTRAKMEPVRICILRLPEQNDAEGNRCEEATGMNVSETCC